jgi:hypothetical protein
MNSLYLVVKSNDAAKMLRRLLPAGTWKEIEFVVEDDPSAAVSTARTLLALGGRPVALVVDAGTTDETQISTQRQTLAALLENASPNVPCRVFVAAPSLPDIFAARRPVNNIPLVQEIMAFVKRVTNQFAGQSTLSTSGRAPQRTSTKTSDPGAR